MIIDFFLLLQYLNTGARWTPIFFLLFFRAEFAIRAFSRRIITPFVLLKRLGFLLRLKFGVSGIIVSSPSRYQREN